MKALELVGEVDERHQLRALLPEDAPAGVVRVLVLWPESEAGEDEATPMQDWNAASHAALREVWDNDEDAIYDQLPAR